MFPLAVAVLLVLAAGVQLFYTEAFLMEATDGYGDPVDASWTERHAYNSAALPLFALEKVSVIICARNEARNIESYLPLILQQDYHSDDGAPAFEVIVVNDRSTDDTAAVLQAFVAMNPHLKVITIEAGIPRAFPGKKDALARGIADATNPIILMTDADCRPASNLWIKWMAYPFSKGMEIVGGYGGYENRPGFLNKFIQCETIHTFELYSGFCRKGKPYMAVGRNLACRKSLAVEAQQHPVWQKTVSGDDDLLIQLCANDTNMAVNSHPDSHTYSIAKTTWQEYLHQKQRHVSTGKLYARRTQILLGGYAFSHALFWILLLIFIYYLLTFAFSLNALFGWAQFGGIAIFMRFTMLYMAFNGSLASTSQGRLKYFWPVFDFCWMLYNIILTPYILWKTKQRWK